MKTKGVVWLAILSALVEFVVVTYRHFRQGSLSKPLEMVK